MPGRFKHWAKEIRFWIKNLKAVLKYLFENLRFEREPYLKDFIGDSHYSKGIIWRGGSPLHTMKMKDESKGRL